MSFFALRKTCMLALILVLLIFNYLAMRLSIIYNNLQKIEGRSKCSLSKKIWSAGSTKSSIINPR